MMPLFNYKYIVAFIIKNFKGILHSRVQFRTYQVAQW